MSKERYDIFVAILLTLSILCLGIQFFFPAVAPVAIAISILAIATITLQMRAKPVGSQ